MIPWPQDLCTITTSKQPMYDDLSALQWDRGRICCALDEYDAKLRTNMLNHSVSIIPAVLFYNKTYSQHYSSRDGKRDLELGSSRNELKN